MNTNIIKQSMKAGIQFFTGIVAAILCMQCSLSTEAPTNETLMLNNILTLMTKLDTAYCEKQGGKCIFQSKIPHTGNFAAISGAANGVDGADKFCNDSSSTGGGFTALTGTYKAMIVDGVNRSGASGAEINWVLQADTTYYRYPDGALVQSTNSSGHFPYSSSYFNTIRYPYVSGEIEFSYFSTSFNWTGANSTDWAAGGVNCSNWASGSSAQTGRYGLQSAATIGEIFYYSSSATNCDSSGSVICVQQ